MKNIEITKTTLQLALAYIDGAILCEEKIKALQTHSDFLAANITVNNSNMSTVQILENEHEIMKERNLKNSYITNYCKCVRE